MWHRIHQKKHIGAKFLYSVLVHEKIKKIIVLHMALKNVPYCNTILYSCDTV